jgi:hypothetical protein
VWRSPYQLPPPDGSYPFFVSIAISSPVLHHVVCLVKFCSRKDIYYECRLKNYFTI